MPDTDTRALDQLAAVEAFTSWLNADKENRGPADRLLDISYQRAPVLRSDLEALLDANRELAQIASERIGQLSQARAQNERLAALLCVCPESAPAAFDPDEQCPIHGEPDKALTLRAVLAERDLLRARLAAAPSGLDVWLLDDPEHQEPGAYTTLEAAQRDALNEAEAFIRVLHLPKPAFTWEPIGDEDWPDWVLLADGELTGWRVHHLLVNGADEPSRAWLFWGEDGTLLTVAVYDEGPVTRERAAADYAAEHDMPAAAIEPVPDGKLPAIRALYDHTDGGRRITRDDLKEILL